MTREKIIDRITKLLALSQSDNQHEAELAAKRASELMEKHQISESAILIDETGVEHIKEERYEVMGQKMRLLWIEILAGGCAKMFDGAILVGSGLHGTRFRWVGHQSDIEAMKALFEHLYQSWFSIVKNDLEESKFDAQFAGTKWQPRDTMKFKQGHGTAYASAIYFRCVELARMRNSNVADSGSSGTALVLCKDQALTEYSEKNKWGKSKSKISAGSYAGRAKGAVAGRNAALGGAIES